MSKIHKKTSKLSHSVSYTTHALILPFHAAKCSDILYIIKNELYIDT